MRSAEPAAGGFRGTARQRIASLMRELMGQVGNEALLSREQEVVLARRVRSGDERAREQLVMSNTRLVANIAMKSFRQGETPGFTIEDAFMAGVEGLIEAIDRFDPERGFKLSTYATWWIKQAIDRAIHNEATTIRMPVHRYEKGEKPHTMHSLDAEIGTATDRGDDRSPLLSFLAHVEDGFDDVVHRLTVERLVCVLEGRERRVIEMRYGLGCEARTLAEVGEELGVTREWIRQIQRIAEERMAEAAAAILSSEGVRRVG